jgi:hypothetical protein
MISVSGLVPLRELQEAKRERDRWRSEALRMEAQAKRLRAALALFAEPGNWLLCERAEWNGDGEEPWALAQAALAGEGEV